jgi:hypothetical protein
MAEIIAIDTVDYGVLRQLFHRIVPYLVFTIILIVEMRLKR